MIMSGAKPSWSNAISLEWQAIDDYCLCKFNKPYFSLDKPCLAKTEDLTKLFFETCKDKRIVKHPSLFLGSMIAAVGEVGGEYTIIEGVLDDVGLIVPSIMIDISEGMNLKKAAKAIWAVSSLFDEGVLLYTVLKAIPSVGSYLNFLRWDGLDNESSLDLLSDGEEFGYKEDYNPLKEHPDLSICMALAFSRDFIFSRFSKMHLDVENILHKKDYSVAVQLRVNQDFVNDVLFELFKERAANAVRDFESSIEILFHDCDSLAESLSLNETDRIKYSVNGQLEKKLGVQINNAIKALYDMSQKLEDDVQYVTLLRGIDFLSNKSDNIKEFDPKAITDEVNEISSRIKSLSQAPVKNAVEISNAAIMLKDKEKNILSLFNEISSELVDHVVDIYSFLEKHSKSSTDDDKPLLSQLEKLEGDLLSCFSESDRYKALLSESKQEVKSLRQQIRSIQCDKESVIEQSSDEKWHFAESLFKGEATLPEACLKYFDERYEDVVILPSAYESAAQIPEFKRVGRMFELIDTLVNVYLPSIVSGSSDHQAKNCFTHSAYKANESDSVKSRSDLMNYRTFIYKGESVVMEQHLGTGVSHNKNETLRIYFKIIDDKVIIGHAGKHLPNS